MRSLSELLDLAIHQRRSISTKEREDRDEYLQELKGFTKYYSHSIKVHLSARDIYRWKLAQRAIQRYIRTFVFESKILHWLDCLLFRRRSDWPYVDDFFDEVAVATGFSLAAFVYGGLHALAWSAHFHSSAEQFLWRISACIVMGSLPIVYVVYGLRDRTILRRLRESTNSHRFFVWDYLYRLLILAYSLARAYLVVESFINLSYLPAGAYDLPNWSAYFPHIS